MTNYIDAEKLIHDLVERIFAYSEGYAEGDDYRKDAIETLLKDVKYQLSLQQEQPEPYFYCKYGGTIPLCSDCKRNHNNSSFKTKEITTWYAPSNGTKHCADYIQKEQPEIDLEKEIDKFLNETGAPYVWCNDDEQRDWCSVIARHFYELGLKARK